MLDIKCLENYRQNEKSNKNEEHYDCADWRDV